MLVEIAVLMFGLRIIFGVLFIIGCLVYTLYRRTRPADPGSRIIHPGDPTGRADYVSPYTIPVDPYLEKENA
jgi:hypothetical protein